MNKKQQELHDLMLSILPFEEFRQNDVVQHIDSGTRGVVLKTLWNNLVFNYQHPSLYTETKQSLEFKFISREWTLNDLLMAIETKWNYRCKSQKIYNKNTVMQIEVYSEQDDCGNSIGTEFYYDLTKSVLEQESIEEIIKVLK